MQVGPPLSLLDDSSLAYNPTGEWVFPCIVSAEPLGSRARARWYMYYSPHENPGGVCLAWADRIEGPWQECERNPVISADWPGCFRVSHVASPHAMWIEEQGRLWLWFHGENHTTRQASSDDGLSFDYEGVAIGPGHAPALRERSYARVFPDPAGRGGYVMLYMGRDDEVRSIHVARSADGRNWACDREPLIVPPPDMGRSASGPWLVDRAGRLRVLHHIDRFLGDPRRFDLRGDFYATDVSADLRIAGRPQVLYQAADDEPDCGRVADIDIVQDGARNWMVYIAGRRLQGRICARPITGF